MMPETRGVSEMRQLFSLLGEEESEGVEFDPALARGLNYYTGAIIEVKSLDTQIGSVCGGGRYDNLAGIFGLEGVSGVGVSFGADRIYDVMMHAGVFPPFSATGTRVMIVNFGGEELRFALELAGMLRNRGVNTELYPDADKLRKQFGYADSRHIPEVIVAGEEEIASGSVTLRNMVTGEQQRLVVEELLGRYER